jgi:hypothetical protein
MSLAAIAALLTVWATACGNDSAPESPPATQFEVTGVVLDVTAASLSLIETLSVGDDAGARWDFRADGYRGWLPSHVRDHMVQGAPVTVTYHEEDGVLMVDEIEDARIEG